MMLLLFSDSDFAAFVVVAVEELLEGDSSVLYPQQLVRLHQHRKGHVM